MDFLRAYLRTLNPPLPTSVKTLQAGALINALGNGLAYPFLFIYLHNVRDIDLATAGLIVGTNSAVGALMSHWPTAPPWSLVMSSSFDANVSYVNFSTPCVSWNSFMLPGST